MRTPAARAQLARATRPYATCLTDAEWALVAPFMPLPASTGRPRAWPMRLVLDGVLYVLRTGCAWAHLPRDFPPPGTVHRWSLRLARSGVFERLAHALAMADRAERARGLADRGRGGRPNRALGRGGRGRRARVRGVALLRASRRPWPFLARCFADRAYAGHRVATAAPVAVTLVGSPPGGRGFAVQPRRWVIERTFAWAGRCRRLARDHEATVSSAAAFLVLAAAMVLVRRLARAF